MFSKIKQTVFFLILVLLLSNCKESNKNYVSFSGKIDNYQNSDTLTINYVYISDSIRINTFKNVHIDKNGNIQDTIKLSNNVKGIHQLKYGDKEMDFYLKNGDDITITFDANNLENTIQFSGNGAKNNNIVVSMNQLLKETLDIKVYNTITLADGRFNEIKKEYYEKNAQLPMTNSEGFDIGIEFTLRKFEREFYKPLFQKGRPSPQFVDYKNINGGTTSLNEFLGKYVFIDLWATWCVPCVKALPKLEKIQEELQGKNIAFISISIDKEKDWDVWESIVKKNNLSGVHLFGGKDTSEFIKNYKKTSITVPRFILLDPKGNIIDSKLAFLDDDHNLKKELLIKLLDEDA